MPRRPNRRSCTISNIACEGCSCYIVYSKSELRHLKYNDSCEVSEEQFGLLTVSTWLRLWAPTIYSYVHEIRAIHDAGHFLPLKHKRHVEEELAFL